LRLDVALVRAHPGLSRRKAREVIEKGQVTVDGATSLDAGRAVAGTERIEWDANRPARRRARSSLPLLYEDDQILVVDKPAGLLSVPSSPDARDEDTVLARVRDYVRHRRPRRPYVGVVHRLDRDTSGALAFALDPATRDALRSLFRHHRIERRYLALVAGAPRGDQGEVDRPLRDEYEGGRRGVARPGEASRPALTRWRVVERFPGAALLEVGLQTGRQHQIRVHLAHVGLPVLGDDVYGRDVRAPVAARRQMLHAQRLGLTHPGTGRSLEVESPLPPDFARALDALRARATQRTPRTRRERREP
jgi:23S rRNA pseudouridine1911/1915/1917 synthase